MPREKKTEYDCSEYIRSNLKELKITQNELAAAIGCSEKTIGRYIQEGATPSPKNKSRIDAYFEKKQWFRNYRHIPSKEFAKRINRYLDYFKNELTQQKLADMLEIKGQGQISKISSGEKALSTEEQYMVLDAFLKVCCKSDNGHRYGDNSIHSRDYKIAEEIIELIYGEEYVSLWIDYFSTDEDIVNTVAYEMAEYPLKIQELILENHLAFFDSAQVLFLDNEKFLSAEKLITAFRRYLSAKQKTYFIEKLEALAYKNNIFTYHDVRDNWELFDMVTHYRNMMKNAKERRIADPKVIPEDFFGEPLSNMIIRDRTAEYIADKNEDKNKEIQARKFEKVFRKVLYFNSVRYNDDDDEDMYSSIICSMIKSEIDFRLTMSPMEWYVWFLTAGYAFFFHEADTIQKLYKSCLIYSK